MDNYYQECPPMMNDGRLFTDYRSAPVREEKFKYKNCTMSENETRIFRVEKADQIMNQEWEYLKKTRLCNPRKKCFHKNPITRVSSYYNNAEILAYNGELLAPECDNYCDDYRMTTTIDKNKNKCIPTKNVAYKGYANERCPMKCAKTNRLYAENLHTMH